MKQSMNRKNRDNTAFLYVRLSRDDNLNGDSYSIVNQKKLLSKVAKEKGYTNLVTYCDDGVSGVTMNRPGFNEMIQELEKGHAAAVFVKDMSRLGRNYIEVGRLTEEFFPDNDIRLVAVSDNLDSDEGENELTPIKNLFNEWYAKDISKKRRISNKIKGTSGEPLGHAPYGYIKDPENPKRWIIDEEAAEVVRRIYRMTIEGNGTAQIAAILSKEHILTPVFYFREKGINRPNRSKDNREPDKWSLSTVEKILSLQEYCGDIINFKTYSKSFKNKKRIENDPENWVVFKDVHDPVVERELWERVQQRRKNRTVKQPVKKSEPNIFAGLLVCADCGGKLNFHFNQKNPHIKYFNCRNNNSCQKSCETTHYIRQDFLEQVLLAEIRRLAQFVTRYEDAFLQAVISYETQNTEAESRKKQRRLKNMIERDKELDRLFERVYEDNLSGKLPDERYEKMSRSYETEQAELSEQIETLKTELEKDANKKTMTTDAFMATVSKYTRARKLTQEMLNELIDHIEVYHAEKIDGVHVQKLIIHYNCIGSIAIPNYLELPEPDIKVQTRKGIEVSYSPAKISNSEVA